MEWAQYRNTKDLEKALEFIIIFAEKCREFIPDNRALNFIHLTNDISNVIKNYQSTTIFYSNVFNKYNESLTRAYNNLKDVVN
jgi:hypothetical protein